MFETEEEAKEEYEKLNYQQPGHEIYPLGAKDTKAKIIYQNFSVKELVKILDEAGESKSIKELKEYATYKYS